MGLHLQLLLLITPQGYPHLLLLHCQYCCILNAGQTSFWALVLIINTNNKLLILNPELWMIFAFNFISSSSSSSSSLTSWPSSSVSWWCVWKVLSSCSTLEVSHPESLMEKVPTMKVFFVKCFFPSDKPLDFLVFEVSLLVSMAYIDAIKSSSVEWHYQKRASFGQSVTNMHRNKS